MIWIFDDDLLLYQLLGLTLDLYVLFSKRFFSISNYLILEVVESERIAHDELRLRNGRPFRLEGNREVANAISFNREGGRVIAVNDEVIAILGRVRHPSNLDVPIALSIVDNRKILGDLAPRRHVHL